MNKQLAFAALTVKAYDDELREFSGIATTPTPDKVQDVVEPLGASFSLPIPLLYGHKRDMPIGEVFWAKVTKAGIEYKARIPKVSEPGNFKDRVDTAWQEVKYKVLKGVSIGFTALEHVPLSTGGIHFKKWRWDELSTVTIPANQEATIVAIKSAYGVETEGATAESEVETSVAIPEARVEGKKQTVVNLARAKGNEMKLSESLKGYQDALATKKADRLQTVQKSLDEGRTADAAELETINTLNDEIKALEAQITMVKGLVDSDIASAAAVEGKKEMTGHVQTVALAQPRAEKGLAMAQLIRVKHLAGGVAHIAAQIAESQKGSLDQRVVEYFKAAVPAATTGVPAWGGNLIAQGGVIGDFVEFLRPQTLLGRFGNGGIPSLRNVPFNVPLIGQTSGGAGYWVGESKAKPLTQFAYGTNILQPLKVANIAVITEELLRRASVSADTMIRDQLVEALRARLDTDFVDPAKAAVTGVSPASITNGVTGIPSSGNDATAIRNDIAALLQAFIAANNIPSTGVLLMGTALALQLSMMQNPLGQSEFPGIGMTGGTFMGFPVLVSDYVPAETVILMNANDVYFADEGGFSVDMSREASLEMADNPAHDSGTPTPATGMVSMFQTNSVAFRAERHLNWAKRRPGAVQLLTGVEWGQPVTP